MNVIDAREDMYGIENPILANHVWKLIRLSLKEDNAQFVQEQFLTTMSHWNIISAKNVSSLIIQELTRLIALRNIPTVRLILKIMLLLMISMCALNARQILSGIIQLVTNAKITSKTARYVLKTEKNALSACLAVFLNLVERVALKNMTDVKYMEVLLKKENLVVCNVIPENSGTKLLLSVKLAQLLTASNILTSTLAKFALTITCKLATT